MAAAAMVTIDFTMSSSVFVSALLGTRGVVRTDVPSLRSAARRKNPDSW
ncbi:hypothetical protein C7S16_5749 [Burkholderia thailandensis]|uniref:Uncharacterized protein n=1 Tax=Burkholderia thailandensis TaxID=57975 RepID=A0AAW9CSQ3_BURTH|nr:hypothetical protein [Burkholderia thailandensis]MDW9253402.1 hypothetical protein [Burkholderia thailandensis]